MADSDFVPLPTEGLVAPVWLAARAALLAGDDALPEVAPGTPGGDHLPLWPDDVSLEFPSTSPIPIPIPIVDGDGDGNALAMTTTIENGFGSRLSVRGLPNSELTDFSFLRTHGEGVPLANRVQPGKRPRASMAPTIVIMDGAPALVIGSPCGSRIIGFVAQSIVAHLDLRMDVQQAVAMGHAVNRCGPCNLWEGTESAALGR